MRFRQPALSSILLLALTIPFVMNYQLWPGETPFLLFGAIFLLLFINLFITSIKSRILITLAVIVLTLGTAYYASIVVRHQTAPEFGVHDIILQLESATQFLLQGVNPYKATYFGTPLEKWHFGDGVVNPALYHFVMPPFYLLFTLPFYLISISFFGFFDGRLPLIFTFAGSLWWLYKLIKDKESLNLALILFAFNPATVDFLIEGRSDIFMHFFLLGFFWFLSQKRFSFSALFLALAFGVKQSAWPILPLYFAYLYFQGKKLFLFRSLLVFGSTILLIFGPFYFWDPKAFLDSTWRYLSGGLPTSYPISGYGFGMVLYRLGLIKDLTVNFPFWLLQLVFGLPLLYYLIGWLRQKTTPQNLLFSYAFFLSVIWYFSRYLNNSHLGYISSLFITAYFLNAETSAPLFKTQKLK